MLNFLENPWVVGICGGIISGIIVYFFTELLCKRKGNANYLERVNRANLDLIHILKPYVVEKGLPSEEVIDAILLSTSRKHEVKCDDMYSVRIICEELIREIIEDTYIPSDKKQEYSQQLSEYLHRMNSEQSKASHTSDMEREMRAQRNAENASFYRKASTILSCTLAVFSFAFTMLSLIAPVLGPFLSNQNTGTKVGITVLVSVAFTITIVGSLLLSVIQNLSSPKKGKHSTK